MLITLLVKLVFYSSFVFPADLACSRYLANKITQEKQPEKIDLQLNTVDLNCIFILVKMCTV